MVLVGAMLKETTEGGAGHVGALFFGWAIVPTNRTQPATPQRREGRRERQRSRSRFSPLRPSRLCGVSSEGFEEPLRATVIAHSRFGPSRDPEFNDLNSNPSSTESSGICFRYRVGDRDWPAVIWFGVDHPSNSAAPVNARIARRFHVRQSRGRVADA
jgi:hypothetical protein